MNIRLDLDGSGLYNRGRILGLEERFDKTNRNTFAPQIEEVRAIRGFDGEVYVNVNDLKMGMLKIAFSTYPTLSVLNFIKDVNYNLQGD